jgi:hypothetical protein
MKKNILLVMAFILFETGCTTINGVGSKATLLPGWDRLEKTLTASIKNAAERERPSKSSNDSFPSGHASGAGLNTGFSRFYMNNMKISNTFKYAGEVAIALADYGCSWARVEAAVTILQML